MACNKGSAMKNIIRIILLQSLFAIITISQAVANPPLAYEGRGLYVSYCQLCHGTDGKGAGPLAKAMKLSPADLTTTVRARSDAILTRIITGEGGPTISGRDRHNLISAAIPEWKDIFNETQVKSLIAYLRFISRSKHDLMGDPKIGLELYQKYCKVCHGADGDGDGVMINLLGNAPMDFTNPNETSSLSNEQILKSILDGKGRFMPAWRSIITQGEIESLVSYIRLLSY